MAENHDVVSYDRYMPKVTLRREGHHKYVVCRFEDVICNVGLVKCGQADNQFKVISQHIFKELLDAKMGNARNL